MSKRFQINVLGVAGLRAASLAEHYLSEESKMIKEVKEKSDFRYDSGDGLVVAMELLRPREPISVFTYRPKYRNSSAIGMFDGKSISWNLYMLDRLSEIDLAANLVHEYAHYCNFHHRDPGYWGRIRENYKTENKCLYSVPYFLSEGIEKGRWV